MSITQILHEQGFDDHMPANAFFGLRILPDIDIVIHPEM